MNKWTLLLCITILSVSCNSILKSKPTGTLSEEQMIELLVDMHLAEAKLKVSNDSLARLHDTTQLRIMFAEVFRKHGINPDDFKASLDYYIIHIEDLDKIYIEVINRLTEIEANLQDKPVKTPGNYKKLKPEQIRILMRNPWYKSMNKSDIPEEIQYFSEDIYPDQFKEIISVPKP